MLAGVTEITGPPISSWVGVYSHSGSWRLPRGCKKGQALMRSFLFSNVPLAKASHMSRLRFKGWKTDSTSCWRGKVIGKGISV